MTDPLRPTPDSRVMLHATCRLIWTCLLAVLLATTGLASQAFAQDGTWATRQPMSVRLYGQGAVTLDGLVYVVGGAMAGGYPTPLPGLTPVYRPSTNTWGSVAPLNDMAPYPCTNCQAMPPGRAGEGSAVWTGRIWVVGGGTGNGYSPGTEIFDPRPATGWTCRRFPPRRLVRAAAVVDGIVYAFGGSPALPDEQRLQHGDDPGRHESRVPTPRTGARGRGGRRQSST